MINKGFDYVTDSGRSPVYSMFHRGLQKYFRATYAMLRNRADTSTR